MQGRTLTRRFKVGLVTLTGFLTLAGCGGEESAFVEPPPGPMTQTRITGSVGDGPVTAAKIVVTNNAGDILAEFQSDMSGTYSVTVEARDTHYPLLVSATGGTDLVTGTAPDFEMLGAALVPGEQAVANVNPLTTLIIEVAWNNSGSLTAENIRVAEEIVLAAIDTGLVTMRAGGIFTTPVDVSNISEVVRASETLAEILRRTRDLLAGTASAADAGGIIRALGADLIDGTIDGNGGSRSDARTAAVASLVAAQVLLEAMANELHVNGVDATEAMRAAIAQVSAGTPDPTLDELTATAVMIDAARLGIGAAGAVSSNPAIAGLASAVAGLQAGMDPALVAAVLPPGYRLLLEDTAVMVASSDDSVIEAVNSTVRNGGTPPPPPNQAPTISGSPPNAVNVDESYSFMPTASDADGDTLTFSITNLPAWASFDTASGALGGTPAAEDAGSYLDIVIDGTDNFPTRYLTNDACVLLGKPNVYGSIFRFEGQATVFATEDGPCYRCLYPEPPPPGLVPSCAEGGVLGILPGTIGVIQATETVKLILGKGESLAGRLMRLEPYGRDSRRRGTAADRSRDGPPRV